MSVEHPEIFRAAAPPRRILMALTAAVVLAHFGALGWVPSGVPQDKPPPDAVPSFITRMVAAPAPPPAPPAPPPPAAAVAPRKAPKPPPKAPPADIPPTPSATESVSTTAAPVESPFGIGPFTSNQATEPEPAGAAGQAAGTADAPASAPPPPVGVAQPVRMMYAATGLSKGLTYHATSELLWQQDGGRYEARMDVSAFLIGAMLQTSSGRVGAQGLVPERFSDKRGRSSEQAAHFDYEQQRIVFSGNTEPAPLQPGAQDRLAVFLQLGALLSGDPSRYPPGSAIALQTVGTRDAEEWTFAVEQQEALDLPAGSVPTVRLARAPRKDYDTRVEVWYAPALGYLPVRIRITQHNGDFVDQQLKSLGKP